VVKFTGKLTPTPSRGGGTLVPMPAKRRQLGLKGAPKVKANRGRPYRGSLMPMGDGATA
jgi:hypothetical protein